MSSDIIQRKNVGEDWINERYRKPKISGVFILEIGCFDHGEISWFLKPYWSKSGFRSLEDWIEEIERLNK